MERKHIYLTKKEIQNIIKESKEKQLKPSELIRRIIDDYFDKRTVNSHGR